MVSVMNRTAPSPNTMLQPPGWPPLENGKVPFVTYFAPLLMKSKLLGSLRMLACFQPVWRSGGLFTVLLFRLPEPHSRAPVPDVAVGPSQTCADPMNMQNWGSG